MSLSISGAYLEVWGLLSAADTTAMTLHIRPQRGASSASPYHLNSTHISVLLAIVPVLAGISILVPFLKANFIYNQIYRLSMEAEKILLVAGEAYSGVVDPRLVVLAAQIKQQLGVMNDELVYLIAIGYGMYVLYGIIFWLVRISIMACHEQRELNTRF